MAIPVDKEIDHVAKQDITQIEALIEQIIARGGWIVLCFGRWV